MVTEGSPLHFVLSQYTTASRNEKFSSSLHFLFHLSRQIIDLLISQVVDNTTRWNGYICTERGIWGEILFLPCSIQPCYLQQPRPHHLQESIPSPSLPRSQGSLMLMLSWWWAWPIISTSGVCPNPGARQHFMFSQVTGRSKQLAHLMRD